MAEFENGAESPFSGSDGGFGAGAGGAGTPAPPPPLAGAGGGPASPFAPSGAFAPSGSDASPALRPAPPPAPPPMPWAGAGYTETAARGGLRPGQGPMLYELRPLSIGEIFDRTFALYRGRFLLYVGLAAVAAAVTTLGEFVRLTWGFNAAMPGINGPVGAAAGPGLGGAGAGDVRAILISVVAVMVTAVLYLVAYSVTQAATMSAVASVYLGEETSIGKALQQVRRHWLRYLGIVLWQAWSMMWLPFALFFAAGVTLALSRFVGGRGLGIALFVLAGLSFIYGFIAYLRNTLGIAASVGEDLGVRAAMRRSKELLAGRKWRPFVLLLLIGILGSVAGAAQSIPALFMMMEHGVLRAVLEALTLLLTFAVGSVVAPVGAIALCLLYLDERVRREGFDVETLMARAGGAGAEVPVASPFSGAGLV